MLPRCHYTVPLPDTAPLQLGRRTLVMGIVNVTSDSFSDGGLCLDPDRAADHAQEMEAAGADLLDIGGESTRPGAAAVSVGEEQDTIEEVYEPFLIQQAFLQKTPKGRLLGKRAYDLLGCKPGEAGPDGGQEMLF